MYLDQAAKDRTSGFNEEFGLHINRNFYIRSRLPMKRVAKCQSARNIQLTRAGKNDAA